MAKLKDDLYINNNLVWHKGNLANGTTSQYIRGDGSLATYSDTTYSALSAAEANTGTATTARTISAKVLADEINRRSDLRYLPLSGGTLTGKIVSSTRDSGIYGTYISTQIDHIWSMGTGYSVPSNGANFGSLYGMGYVYSSHSNAPIKTTDHQIAFTAAGNPGVSIGLNSGTVWTKSHGTSVNWKAGYDYSQIGHLYEKSGRDDIGLDTRITSGLYGAGGSAPGSQYSYSPYLVARMNDTGWQLQVDRSGAGISFRGFSGSGSSFTPWRSLYHSGNFANGTTAQYIRGDGSLATYANTTYSNFTRTVSGLVPAPGLTTTTRYLREDGTWVIPPDTNTTYSVMSVAEGTTGTATSSRTMRADYLKQIIQHYSLIAGIRVGASGTAANTAITDPYIKVVDNESYREQFRLIGGTNVTVASATNGDITITAAGGDDTKVTQTANSASPYRPFLLGYNSVAGSTTTFPGGTGQSYYTNKIRVQPSSGNIITTGSIDATGAITTKGNLTATGNLYVAKAFKSSDIKLKNSIDKIDTSDIHKIDLVQFKWNKDGLRDYGVIAQTVEQYYPELVSKDNSGNKVVNYESLYAIKIKFLEEKVLSLENKITEIKNRL